jgi:RHS repeat-associated protein
VAAQRAYDPYGSPDPGGNSKLLNGDPVSSTGFRGANTDKVTGNLLLGARAYDPETDRFTSADFFVGSSQDLATGTDPLTGNRYLFAAANPVGYFDDGHMPLCDGFRCSAGSSNAGRTGGDGDSYGGSSFPSADGANSQRFELSAARGGFVQVDFFIADYSSFALRGDNRDFSSARGDKSSRVRIEIDLAAGHAKATIFKSCLLVSFRGFGCVAAEPLNGADNQISIRNTKSGSILIKYDLINSVTSKLNSGSIDGVVLLVPDGGTFDVITRRDPYPSLEAYQYQGGLTRILAQEDEKPWWAAFPVLTRTQLHDH